MYKPIILAYDFSDPARGKHEDWYVLQATMIDEKNALFIEGSEVKIVGVEPTDIPGVYRPVRGSMRLGKLRKRMSVDDILHRLKSVSMYDFVINVADRGHFSEGMELFE